LKKPALKLSSIISWIKARKQKSKEREEQERQSETFMIKMLTFVVTLIAMALGMSFLPLFPQPLPIFVAFLVAFLTYIKPRFGMPIGGFVIGLGLLFHLAQLYFISFLGETPARVVFIVVWMALFVVLPVLYNRYKSAIAVNFGILAFVALFFMPTYFLAIPLILASAVFFKKYAVLTAVYYVLLSIPLQLVQYFQYTVLPIIRDEWWLEAGSAPPLFVPLSSISKDLGLSMTQFRLYDTSKVIYDIAGQTTWIPDWTGRTIKDALTQYLDSLPGILMFVIIVVGLAFALIFFTRVMVNEGIIGSGDRFFPCFTATIAAAIFFVLLSALQKPLAFTANVSPITMVMGIFGTLLFTLPVLFIDFNPKQRVTNQEITDKTQSLLNKVLVFEGQLNNIKENSPVIVSSPEGKMLLIKDSLGETLKKANQKQYRLIELDQKFEELEKLENDQKAIETELDSILKEYQLLVNSEFSNWAGKLKQSGLEVQTTLKTTEFKIDMPLEQRIQVIKETLEAGRSLAKEVIEIATPIYTIIQSSYNPALPKKNAAIAFAAQKIEEKVAPWIAIETLYNALNNWKRQYGNEIQTSMEKLEKSIKSIITHDAQNKLLPAVFGADTQKVRDYYKKMDEMKTSAKKRLDKEKMEIYDVISLNSEVQSFLGIFKEVLFTLHNGLVREGEAIDRLFKIKDELWEKNNALLQRLQQAIEKLSGNSSYLINQVLLDLPEYLSYVDEAVETLSVYRERKEILLNYPLAKVAIEELLKEKEEILPKDLPFNPLYSAEYLKIFYLERFGDYNFDKENRILTKR
jgi:hypothetical protein